MNNAELDEKIKEIQNQISYWQQQTFVTEPKDMEQLKTTITSLEYVLYNYIKMKNALEDSLSNKESS